MSKLLRGLIACLLAICIATPKVIDATTIEVTFNGNGGLYNESEPQLKIAVKEDGTIGEDNWPSDPTMVGYNFVGYDVDANSNTVFTEETTLTANWQAKETTISLNADDGENGDTTVQATYGSTLPSITIPTKEGYNFLGYFNNDVQYYDADGNSSVTWDLEDETFELIAHYEEVEEEQAPMLLGVTQKHIITVDLNGGTLTSDVPAGWTYNQTNNVYTSEVEDGTYYYWTLDSWKNYASVENSSYYLTGYTDNHVENYIHDDSLVWTAQYVEGININVVAGEHGSVTTYRNTVKKTGGYVEVNSNTMYDSNYNVVATANGDDGYTFGYWEVNGVNVSAINYKYDVTSETEFKAVFVKEYDITVDSKRVNEYIKDDIAGDGCLKYDPTTNTLTINGKTDYYYYISGIYAVSDLTIITTDNVKVSGFTNSVDSDIYGIYSGGNLVINASGNLQVEASVSNPSQYIGKKIIGIYGNNVTINSGNIDVVGATYGVRAESTLTVNDADKPLVKSYSNNTVAFSANSIVLNGNPKIYGSSSEYTVSDTKTLLQTGQDGVTITYDESDVTLYDLWIGGVRVTSENESDVLNDGKISYEPSTKTLTFENYTYISGKDGYGIYCKDNLNIYIKGYTNISADSSAIYSTGVSYGIYCEGDLNISGDNNDFVNVYSSNAQTISCGIFCDGRLTVTQKVKAYSYNVEFLNNETEDFCISAGVWAKGGIDVIGNDKNVKLLEASGGCIKNVSFDAYGILSGDGNPGYAEEATINVTSALIQGGLSIKNPKASSYGIFSYGTITANNATISAGPQESLEDNAGIHCEEDFIVENESVIDCNSTFGGMGDERKLYFVDVEGTMTVDNSSITIFDGYDLMKAHTKKSHTIHTKNLVVKNNANIDVKGFEAVDESAAIYVENKLDIQGGTIKAYGGKAGDCSYGIYAGSQSFDGSHSISSGNIEAKGNTCGNGSESIGLRTKKGNLNISGGTLTLSGNTNGLNASGVITVSNVDATHISASSTNKNAVYSKEPLVLNDAVIENATELYVTDDTKELVQSGNNPVIIRFKIQADVSGISVIYPEGKTSYVYGDGVLFTGDPVVTVNTTGDVITDQIEYFEYILSRKVDGEWSNSNNVPDIQFLNGKLLQIGDYRLLVTYYDNNYEGSQEILFSVGKRPLTVNYDSLNFEFDGDPHKPGLVFEGLLDGDVASFDEEVAATIYDENESIVNSAINTGKYKIVNNITTNNTFRVLYDGDDMTSNYELETGIISSNFYIFDSIYTTANIITGSVNDSNAYSSETAPITADSAKIIVGENQELLTAINDGKNVLIYTKLDSILDANAFDEKNINNKNAFLFSASLLASIDGSTVVYPISDTNGSKIKISVYLDESQVKNIVGSNKNYFVYRKHNGVISELPCRLDKVNDYYMFTFENDLFSDFAIFSKDKPVNPSGGGGSTKTYSHVVPNTGETY